MEQERTESESTIDLRSILSFILRKWWIVLICLAVGLGAGGIYGAVTSEDEYSEEAVFVVSYYDGTPDSDMSSYQSRVASMLGGCVTLIRQNRFARAVVAQVQENGRMVTEEEVTNCLEYSFSVSGNDTDYAGNYIYITATSPDPDMTYDIIVAASEILNEYVSENYILAGSAERLVFSLANDLEVPQEPVADMSVLQYMLIFGAVCLVLCIVVLAIIEMADQRVKGEDDLVATYNLAVLGSVPDFEDKNLTRGGYYGKK